MTLRPQDPARLRTNQKAIGENDCGGGSVGLQAPQQELGRDDQKSKKTVLALPSRRNFKCSRVHGFLQNALGCSFPNTLHASGLWRLWAPCSRAEISDPPAGASLPPGACLAPEFLTLPHPHRISPWILPPATHPSLNPANHSSHRDLLSPLSAPSSPRALGRPLFQLSLPFFVFQMEMIMVTRPILQASLEAEGSGIHRITSCTTVNTEVVLVMIIILIN